MKTLGPVRTGRTSVAPFRGMDETCIRLLRPQPDASELPAEFPDPLRAGPPHSLARRAARELMLELETGRLGDSFESDGKMFGVLVVRDAAGRVGYLRAFSGMIGGRWQIDGFSPPVFDLETRDAFWRTGESSLDHLSRQLAVANEDQRRADDELAAVDERQRLETEALRAEHRRKRAARRARRAGATPDERAALDQESRTDRAERRRFYAEQRGEREPFTARSRRMAAERRSLEERRSEQSRCLLERIQDLYVLESTSGERARLSEIFAPDRPPGGAGDCAGPKLLAQARALALRPVALAEFWWGAPPLSGGRISGAFYPSCRGKCGPILRHLLRGLTVEVTAAPGSAAIAAHEPATVFEDDWMIAVHKPRGLLSVPGRTEALRDSVLTRLRERYPEATGPLLVHRLDLDTSGLLLAAKSAEVFAELHRAFAERRVEKTYVAVLGGHVRRQGGSIDLALRVDLDDRPRQIHDPDHGKPALTHWSVVARSGETTRVELVPVTGRTHQLRVHAAHPLGIGVPVVGDRLYGVGDGPLLLHARTLRLRHPVLGDSLELSCPAPF